MDFKTSSPRLAPQILRIREQGRMFRPLAIEDNPMFDRWFAKSRVVDELGRPKVAQHATSHQFDRFDVSKIGGGYNRFGPGFYFTDGCAKTIASFGGEQGRVLNAYLSLQNPITSGAMKQQEIHRFFNAIEDKVFSNGFDATAVHEDIKLDCLREPEFAFDKLCAAASNFITQEDWFRGMKAAGFDGVMRPVHGVMEYVLLDPRQIKSTTNNGNFDPLDERYDA